MSFVRILSCVSAGIVLSLAVGCGGEDDGKSDDCPPAMISADIDGSAWDASLEVCAVDGAIFSVTGSDSGGKQLFFSVMGADTGAFTVDGIMHNGRWNEGTDTYTTLLGGPGGTVTFDTKTDTTATGTFSFTATNVMTQSTVSVTNGVFDVEFEAVP